jgi:hypothetical protein
LSDAPIIFISGSLRINATKISIREELKKTKIVRTIRRKDRKMLDNMITKRGPLLSINSPESRVNGRDEIAIKKITNPIVMYGTCLITRRYKGKNIHN